MDFRPTSEQLRWKRTFDERIAAEMRSAPPEFHNGGMQGIYGSPEGFAFHRRMARVFGEEGWLGLSWPSRYGGRDRSPMEHFLFFESVAEHEAPGVDAMAVRMFAPTLLLGGTEEQKERLLPPILRGEATYCQGWSEPNAGSDLASLGTTAIRDGDAYVVNGQKIWTTGAHLAEFMFLLARTDPASTRSRGLSMFHLRMDTPGLVVRPIESMTGRHFAEVFFEDVRIPARDLIGAEGEGWSLTRATMNFERSGIGSFLRIRNVVGKLVRYAKTTTRDGRLLAEDPSVREKLARLATMVEVGRSLSYAIAWYQTHEGLDLPAHLASESKLFATRAETMLATYGTEILGPYGQLLDSEWTPLGGQLTELYQETVATNIAGGSSEIQRNIIAWAGVGLPRVG